MSKHKNLISATRAWTPASPEAEKQLSAYESALGRLTMNFSLLHFALERFSWGVWKLGEPIGHVLTKNLQLRQITTRLKESAEHVMLKERDRKMFISILNRTEKAAEDRNELLHSLWMFTDDEPVFCLSRKRGRLEGPAAPSVDQIDELSETILDILGALAILERLLRRVTVFKGLLDAKPPQGKGA